MASRRALDTHHRPAATVVVARLLDANDALRVGTAARIPYPVLEVT